MASRRRRRHGDAPGGGVGKVASRHAHHDRQGAQYAFKLSFVFAAGGCVEKTMKLARKIQHRRHPSRQATQTKAEDGDAKEDKEGDKEGEADDAASDSKEKDMRRLPPQGKEKSCGSPRVTLRIHQVKDKREKKNSVDHEPYNGNMESGKGADDNGSAKEASAVEESQSGGGGGGRSSPSDKEGGAAAADGGVAAADAPAEKTAAEGGPVAGVKRSHSTEDETSGGALGEDGKKRRRKEDKVKSGSNSGGSPKSLVSIESEGEDAKSVESPGPKVPPLKIVISGASLEEPGSGGRNGKNGSGRHHLPYVVSAPPEAPDAAPAPLQLQPAADEAKDDRGSGSGEEGGGQPAGPGGAAAGGPAAPGGRSHQRVLRSHRGKKGEGRSNKDKDKDKDSNSNSGSATSSPAGMGEVASPRQVSPTPGAGSEIASEGEEKPPVAAGTTNTVSIRGERESTSGRDSDVEKTATPPPPPPQELHPRKRKIRPREAPPPSNGTNGSHVPPPSNGTNSSSNSSIGSSGPGSDSGADASLGGTIGTSAALESITNSYQLFLNIRKQIERKRKGLFPVQPKPPQGFKDYLMNRCTYVLANNNSNRVPPPSNKPPPDLHVGIKELFLQQEKERHRLLMQHVIEKEKLVLSVEQEILRVHGRAARALANQALPFSACTILRDEEVYSAITPEQEEKDRNARSRYNGRLFLSWLQDVDDKWEKIKEAMLLRHHNEAESLHAVQKMDWEWKMKELAICEMKSSPVIDETHVPVVHVSDDFDLLPA